MRLALGESETGRFRIFAEMKVYSHLLGGERREKCNKSGNGDRPKQPQAGSQVASMSKNLISRCHDGSVFQDVKKRAGSPK